MDQEIWSMTSNWLGPNCERVGLNFSNNSAQLLDKFGSAVKHEEQFELLHILYVFNLF